MQRKNDNNRPDPEATMKGLKTFQQRTVDYVFQKMYLDENPQNRFLIADEVGLGKTLVARGLVARVADHLWDTVNRTEDRRVDIVYVCSNQDIARQNINRLNITPDTQFAFSTRLTMLPLHMSEMEGKRLNFVSFTPGTSFQLASCGGRQEERMLLYWILRDIWGLSSSQRYVNFFQCNVQWENWRRRLNDFRKHRKNQINREICRSYKEFLDKRCEEESREGKQTLRERFEETAKMFSRLRKNIWPRKCRSDRNLVIGQLRELLSHAAVNYLQPNLIILDEFQRFRDILERKTEMSQIAHRLFDYDDSHAGQVRVVLLSATPYKMYTMHHETEQEEHYGDFVRTLKFLFNDPERTGRFEKLLRQYRMHLFSETGKYKALNPIKNKIQRELCSVMVRTERFYQLQTPDGMVTETFGNPQLLPKEVREYAHLRRISQGIGTYDFLQYWKSAPYLMSFMDSGYKARKIIEELLDGDNAHGPVNVKLITALRNASLPERKVEQYKEIDPNNARLRVMRKDMLDDREMWRLLWIPPAFPYYQPGGAYKQVKGKDITKSLVFSSWRLVPRMISMMMSYEAERRMVGRCGYRYSDLLTERRPLLLFRAPEGRPENMPSMALFYPCVSLAREIDPAIIASEISSGGNLPERDELINKAAAKIRFLLQKAGIKVESGSEHSRREREELWKYMIWIDRAAAGGVFEKAVGKWLETNEEGVDWSGMLARRENETDAGWESHVELIRKTLASEPDNTVASVETVRHLAWIALSSPAVTALRSLLRMAVPRDTNDAVRSLAGAARIAIAFRSRFNQPWSIEMIGSDSPLEPYWWRVICYCQDGNLQAVMDEYAHVLCETEGLSLKTPDEVYTTMAEHISSVLSIQAARLTYDTYGDMSPLTGNKPSLRCHFALRLGDDKEVMTQETGMRRNVVRNAFNSPFYPFVLATTSIGQEGLDFHLYCHRIYHWNLPSNPIDMEQREGRINRYKGHLIRCNVADRYGRELMQNLSALTDPWQHLFDLAQEEYREDDLGLRPFWIYEIKSGRRLQRCVPALPYSQDRRMLDDTKRTLVFYRMVFGQPRQQDLIEYLKKQFNDMGEEELLHLARDCSINLQPPGLSIYNHKISK